MQTRPFHVCLVCSSCPSVRDFACSFLQISPHGEHPCCLANGSHYQAHSGLSPPSYCPCRANIKKAGGSIRLLFKKLNPAATYSPKASPPQYHQRWRTLPVCSEWEPVLPLRYCHRAYMLNSLSIGDIPQQGIPA